MKNSRHWLNCLNGLITLCGWIFWTTNMSQSFSQDLVCSLGIEKSKYFFTEPILVELTISNRGRREVEIGYPTLDYRNVEFRIENSDGRFRSNERRRTSHGHPARITLPPNTTWKTQFGLTRPYGETDSINGNFHFLPIGDYRIRAVYRPFDGEPPLSSNAINIEVIEVPDSEMQAYERWVTARRVLSYHSQEKILALRELIDKFPNSPFSQFAVTVLITELVLNGDTASAGAYLHEALNRYPASWNAIRAIRRYGFGMTTQERLNLFRSIEQQHKGTILGNKIAEEIERVNFRSINIR